MYVHKTTGKPKKIDIAKAAEGGAFVGVKNCLEKRCLFIETVPRHRLQQFHHKKCEQKERKENNLQHPDKRLTWALEGQRRLSNICETKINTTCPK